MAHPRNPKNWCSVCGKHIKNSSSGLCREHWKETQLVEFGKITIGELKATNSRHRYQTARHHAHRIAALYLPERVCAECGYSIYVELCHIHSIGEFPSEATLTEVNSLENLRWLCPNHHKELDLGLMRT